VISHALFFGLGGGVKPTGVHLTGGLYFGFMATVIGCVFFHELGHLSACERYGARHGEAGIGFFLIWPVAYADVTDCWSLKRYQRAVVDAGGIYFHSICSSICCWLWIATGHPLWWAAVYSVMGSTIVNINPFVRFDGYWFLTDVTGIPSLHRSMREAGEYYLGRVRGASTQRKPEILDTRPIVVALFLAYCVGTVIFVLYLMLRVSRFLPRAIEQIPGQLIKLWDLAHVGELGWEFWKLALATAAVCLTVYSLSNMLWRRLSGFAKRAVRIVRAPAKSRSD